MALPRMGVPEVPPCTHRSNALVSDISDIGRLRASAAENHLFRGSHTYCAVLVAHQEDEARRGAIRVRLLTRTTREVSL